MCFSAAASFTGGAIVSTIGFAAMKRVRKPSQRLFAGIPLFFGVQQIAEGFLWLSFTHPEYAAFRQGSMYLFLFMARVFWPAMLPLSVLWMEEDPGRKKKLGVLLAMGLTVSFYYTYCLVFLNVAPDIAGNHIQYISDFPESLAVPVFIIYFIASIVPLFISGMKRVSLLGVLMAVSGIASAVFFTLYLTSVWCFFAAIISVVIYWILSDGTPESIKAM
jgi:hypothetical protein